MGNAKIDWDSTLAFLGCLTELGLGIAEAMDAAQRGMGLNWLGALEVQVGRLSTSSTPALNSGVWRIVDGQFAEAWDIPSAFTQAA